MSEIREGHRSASSPAVESGCIPDGRMARQGPGPLRRSTASAGQHRRFPRRGLAREGRQVSRGGGTPHARRVSGCLGGSRRHRRRAEVTPLSYRVAPNAHAPGQRHDANRLSLFIQFYPTQDGFLGHIKNHNSPYFTLERQRQDPGVGPVGNVVSR